MHLIDAHIHLDHYKNNEIERMLEGLDWLKALISVSFDLDSCERNLQLSRKYEKVKPAFGFHPEQSLPAESELSRLFKWINQHHKEMIAVGEVGLPFYLRKDQKVSNVEYGQYLELLESFIELAKKWDKPIALHAVYEDAPIVCDLLEKHTVRKAHFHWFKGDEKTTRRMMENGYFISVTPEVVYREKIQKIVQAYPLEQLMVETDGPWPFEGPFTGKMTHPEMMMESIAVIASIKKLPKKEVAEKVLGNTKKFYGV